MLNKEKKRIVFVDVARSFAIVLALVDHSLNDFGIWHDYPFHTFAMIKTITSAATPTFLFLFGMMLELVYLKSLNNKGLDYVAPKLLKRSLQCYFGYLLTIVAGFLGGILTFKRSIAAALFMSNTHYGNILKLYAVMLIIAIPLLIIRRKYGIRIVWFVVMALSFSSYFLFKDLPIGKSHLTALLSTLFGIGASGGPSIFNSLTLVITGMLCAGFISYEKKYRFIANSGILWIATFVVVFLMVGVIGPKAVIENYYSNTFRIINHPFYYMAGLNLSILIAIVFAALFPIGARINNHLFKFLIFGRSSLMAFTTGNVILNLFLLSFLEKYSWNLTGPFAFIALVYFILYFYENRIENKDELRIRPVLFARELFVNRFFNPASGLLVKLFIKYDSASIKK